jgi:hypothetical protein
LRIFKLLAQGACPNHSFEIENSQFDFYKGLYMKNVAKIKQEGSFGELELISNEPEHQKNGATIKC